MGRHPWRAVAVAGAATVAALFAMAGSAGAAPAAPPAGPAPLVRGFAPAKGAAGTVVTVNGRYFSGASMVSVGGAASAFSVRNDRTLSVTVAPGAATGAVAVTTASGTGSGPVFTLDARTVRGFSPTSGPPGTVVALLGFNFLGTSEVRFAGIASPAFSVIDDRTIYAEVPAGAAVGSITVVEGGAVGTSLPFSYDPVTLIRGFGPREGGPGVEVTINGRNFTAATGVDFAGTPAYSFAVVSNTQITAVVPPGAVTGLVTVHGVDNDSTFGAIPFTVHADLTAIFPLSVSKLGAGSGLVSSPSTGIACGATCTSSFPFLASVTLTAVPDAGSSFAGWSGACSGTGPCTVSVSGVVSVSATFLVQSFALSVFGAGGTLTSSPAGISCGVACSASFNSGTTVTLTGTPAAGGLVASWSGCDSVSGSTCSVVVGSARNVTAVFTFPLMVSRSGTGSGTVTSSPAGISCGVTCSASFAFGASVALSASANAGSSFAGWSGACSGTGPCTVSVSGVISVTATFTAVTFNLSVSRNGNAAGSVTSAPAGISCGVTCSAAYGSGTTVTLTAAGASVGSWSGCDSVSGSTCTVSVSSSRSVSVTFL